jgi:hypothetical protein
MTVPQITESWTRTTEKFNSKSLKIIDASAAGEPAAAPIPLPV